MKRIVRQLISCTFAATLIILAGGLLQGCSIATEESDDTPAVEYPDTPNSKISIAHLKALCRADRTVITDDISIEGHVIANDLYGEFINRCCKKLRRFFPNAKIIFATSTPVVEHRFSPDSYRLNKDVIEYNKIAVAECLKYGFEIDDLYSVAEKFPEEYYSDCTHLRTEDGTRIMTGAVSGSILKALGIDEKDVDMRFEFEGNTVVIGH